MLGVESVRSHQSLVHTLVLERNGTAPVEDSMGVPPKLCKMRSANSTSGHILKRTESRVLKTHFQTHVPSSAIHSSQKVGATQVSMGKEREK